ncbi:MAG: glycoside/pentoside/hexuronide transporter [Micrococcaceae bacterium]|nr:glycoside/pentoside/hexuronide transporter [Micrococcaceae bacterium]
MQGTGSTGAGTAAAGLRRRAVLGYGVGDSANSMVISTANMFLLVYYTDVAGIPAAAAGTLLLLVRLFNAVTDIVAGRVADRSRRSRWGKFRPFLFFGAVPLLCSAAAFSVPPWDADGKLIYAYVTYACVSLSYSLVNVPYGCLVGAMTQNPRDRARLASARTLGGLTVGALLGLVVAPLLESKAHMQQTFTVTTLVFVAVGTGLYLLTAVTAQERVHQDVEKITIRQSVATLRQNSPLLVLCSSSVLFVTGTTSMGAAQFFYLRDVLGRLDLYPVVSLGQVVITLSVAVLMPRLVLRWGKRSVYCWGGSLAVVGGAVSFAAPSSVPSLGIGGILLSLCGSAVVGILMWALVADTVEFGQWKTDVRVDGVNYALLAATRKLGMAFGGALAAFALSWGGYVSGAGAQSEDALAGIRSAAGLLPAALVLFGVLIMRWYRLTEERHAELVAELGVRTPSGT